jgi:ABC-type uncharacterized transport system involved in gliding motility auxiliary subunit
MADKTETTEKTRAAASKAMKLAVELRDKATGWMLLAPGEANRAVSNMGGKMMSWLAIVLGGVMLLSANIIIDTLFKGSSADLTENKLYSISDSTRRVLGKLDEPIDLRLYFSDGLGDASPVYKRYFERVRALLQQYSNIAGGKLNISFIDPEPFSDAEDRAVSAGLQGLTLNAEGDKGYFGLVAENSTDNTETVTFFSPQRENYLEYDLTKLIHKLATPKKIVVGLMSSLQIDGGFDMQTRQQLPAWQIMTQIKEFFEVKQIPENSVEIPGEIEVLMLVHPNGLTAEAAYAIDQFALKGGRILAFVDPVSELSQLATRGAAEGTTNEEMAKLLKSWGVNFDPAKVAGDLQTARRVQLGGAQPVITEYVAWLALKEGDNIENTDVISDGVKLINIVSAGLLEPLQDAKTKFEPILRTSPSGAEIEAVKLRGLEPDPVSLLRDFKPGNKPLVMAARITGEISTAFPDGPPKPKEEDKGEKAEEKENKTAAEDKGETEKDQKPAAEALRSGSLNAIVVADTDFLYDQFWVEQRQMLGQQMLIPVSHNSVFVINALENLSGGEALSGLRGRGVDNRPFDTVDEIRRSAEKEYRQREQVLSEKLKELRSELAKVHERSTSGSLTLSDEDKKAVEKFNAELLETRQQLRAVRHGLRADIDRLENRVMFINIALVPLLIGLGGFAFAAWRRRNRPGRA